MRVTFKLLVFLFVQSLKLVKQCTAINRLVCNIVKGLFGFEYKYLTQSVNG